jgi:uncharacterized membrane protein
MQLKAKHVLYGINVLTVALILVIVFFPTNVLRVILGLPLVLFFPGYTLIVSLFPRKASLDSIEKVALSFGLSIAVVPLIGLALNYTPWGIHLNSILISITLFIVIFSVLAWLRQSRLTEAERPSLSIPLRFWSRRSLPDKILSVALVVAIFGAIGTAGYVIAVPKTGERYTEFYVLGSDGTAENYPRDLKLGDTGSVTLGIVNHEGVETSYRVEVKVDGELNNSVDPLVLAPEEKYENEVSFTPRKLGANQNVEFLLYRNGQTDVYLRLHFWLNVVSGSG